jgi:glycosyltransferase involved in cell wall biosynthesis
MYDLAFVRFPEIYSAPYRQYLDSAIRSLRPSDHVITTSNFVRDELAANGVATPDRIHVVPLAADPAVFYRCQDPRRVSDVRRKYRIPDGPYVLGVNTPDLRKNVPHAIHAFARAWGASPDAVGSFVLSGHPGPGSDLIAEAIGAHPEIQERFVLTGYVPDEDLAPLYTGARMFVYSSIYEGFGLPPLEAMQCGTPVIVSNTSSLPEVVGDAGVLVQPHDLHALAAAMLSIANDDGQHRSLQDRALAQAGRFSWDRSTAATLNAYRTALRQSRVQ